MITHPIPTPHATRSPASRIEQLDSLRGLAALSVVVHHHLLILPAFYLAYCSQLPDRVESYLFYPPIYLLHAGHAAVMLFFLLSGFVLMLPFLRGRQSAYPLYALKRICRIYIPYLVSVVAAMLAATCLYKGGISSLSEWFQDNWYVPVSGTTIIEHVALVYRIPRGSYNNVIWSLVYEMRISLIFPFLALMVLRFRWWWSAAAAVCFSLIGIYAPMLHWRFLAYREECTTIHYAAMFILGAILAKYHQPIAGFLTGLSKPHKVMVVGLGVILYLVEGLHPVFRTGQNLHHVEQVTVIGAAVILVTASSSQWLRRPICVWLGQISYSLYLWHVPILLTTVTIGYAYCPLWMLMLLSMIFSILTANLMYKLVEEPSIALSQKVGKLRFRSTSTPVNP